ncbi:hypothetical protein HAX54_009587 [Datura stramonium]|uniref:Uncharacterized protein n=1 Tax=Datura stramonium TaxID=4076 RepID=A0ABS8TGC9_DATST|nr:hypothetical protein [Datura stramonium]
MLRPARLGNIESCCLPSYAGHFSRQKILPRPPTFVVLPSSSSGRDSSSKASWEEIAFRKPRQHPRLGLDQPILVISTKDIYDTPLFGSWNTHYVDSLEGNSKDLDYEALKRKPKRSGAPGHGAAQVSLLMEDGGNLIDCRRHQLHVLSDKVSNYLKLMVLEEYHKRIAEVPLECLANDGASSWVLLYPCLWLKDHRLLGSLDEGEVGTRGDVEAEKQLEPYL